MRPAKEKGYLESVYIRELREGVVRITALYRDAAKNEIHPDMQTYRVDKFLPTIFSER